MVLSQKLHEAFKGTVERITGPRTVSAFKEKGVLSVSEFVFAGDNLVSKCPTWSWESGEPSKRKSYLPPDKQFLITRNVPCLRRAASIAEEYDAAGGEVLLDDENNDGWLATHGKPKETKADEDNLPSMETLEISKGKTIQSISSYFGGDNEDDIPDMAEYEDQDNIIENDLNRREFEGELIQRFGSLVKMPLLKSDKNPLPDAVKSVLQEGIDLYKLHFKRHRRLDSTKGTYVSEWAKREKQMRDTISSHAKYINSIQEPFELAVSKVLEQLKSVAKGEFTEPCTKSRKLGSSIIYAAITLHVDEMLNDLNDISRKKSKVKAFLKDKLVQESLRTAHVTLAHKRIHGVTDYEQLVGQKVDVELTALLFSDKMAAAIEVRVGSVEGREVECKNEWPHVTVWTEEGVAAKEAKKNLMSRMLLQP